MGVDQSTLEVTDTSSMNLALLRMLGASVAIVLIVLRGETYFGASTTIVAFLALALICIDFGTVAFRSFTGRVTTRIAVTDTQLSLRPKLYNVDKIKTFQIAELSQVSILRSQQRNPFRLHIATQDETFSISLSRLSHTPDEVLHAIILRLENLGMTVELNEDPKLSLGTVWDVVKSRALQKGAPLTTSDIFEGFDAD